MADEVKVNAQALPVNLGELDTDGITELEGCSGAFANECALQFSMDVIIVAEGFYMY